jgi:exodeoxyribonuclease-3
MRIISFNVNGVRSIRTKTKEGIKRTDDTPCVLATLIKEQIPDILCLQEVRADNGNELQEFKQQFPYQYINTSKTRKGYSGVAILSKNRPMSENINFSRFSEEQIGVYEDKSYTKEGRLITLEYATFCVVNSYTPNAKPRLARIGERMEWDILFRKYVKMLEETTNKPVIAVGDLNCAHNEIDIHDPVSNKHSAGFSKEERSGFNTFLCENTFIDTFRTLHPDKIKYSWFSNFANCRAKNMGWRIDYILASSSLQKELTYADILNDYYGSDHCPVIAEFTI